MADNKDYRDPKVTQDKSSGGIGKWIVIAIVALLALLALLWLLGLLGDDDVATTADPEAIIVTPEAQEEGVIVTE